jgi:lactate dehydrogenase-like 2-hydroxyacid dehydrogenase
MSKSKLFATRPLFESVRKLLEGHCEVEYWRAAERIPRAELLGRVADKDGLICLLTERVDGELLAGAPRLRMAATVSVGYDNIDVPACTRRGVVAVHTPGVLDETTAEFAWVLMLAVARRLVEASETMQAGTWTGWDLDQFCGADVWGKTLGVVGFGRIGRCVARRALGFRMRVLYSDAVRAPAEVERELSAEHVPFDRLLAEADFVTVHVPLLPSTRHLMSAAQFAKMKQTAFLINTSRGPVVDEAALVQALDAGQIAGAALDVHENEPVAHPGLPGRKNVLLTPHIASASLETRTRMAMLAAEDVVAYFSGRRPAHVLNPEALEKRAGS